MHALGTLQGAQSQRRRHRVTSCLCMKAGDGYPAPRRHPGTDSHHRPCGRGRSRRGPGTRAGTPSRSQQSLGLGLLRQSPASPARGSGGEAAACRGRWVPVDWGGLSGGRPGLSACAPCCLSLPLLPPPLLVVSGLLTCLGVGCVCVWGRWCSVKKIACGDRRCCSPDCAGLGPAPRLRQGPPQTETPASSRRRRRFDAGGPRAARGATQVPAAGGPPAVPERGWRLLASRRRVGCQGLRLCGRVGRGGEGEAANRNNSTWYSRLSPIQSTQPPANSEIRR